MTDARVGQRQPRRRSGPCRRRKQVGAAQRVGYPARAPSASAMCRHASRCGVERGRCRTTQRTERATWTPSFSSRSRSHVTVAAGTRSHASPHFAKHQITPKSSSRYTQLFHEHASERLHQRTNPILRPIGEMVVQHQPLPKQRMRPPLHRVRLQPAVITDALARRTQQRQHGDRQRADQQQAVPPVRARNMHRRQPHPEAQVLDVPKARLNPPALAVVPNQDPRRDCCFAGHQTPRFVHLRILYAHDHADRQLVRVGHPSTHQPPRTPAGADPRGGRSPLAPRIRHIDVPTQPNHVFEGQLRRQRVEQLAIRKAPIRHNGDFHPGRQHLPQPAQHLVLIAPLIPLQRRGRHRLPQQGRRAPMASHHRQHDRVLPVGGKTRPIQRNDHLRAGADDDPASSMRKRSRRRRLDCSGADPPASHHAWSTYAMAWAKPRPTAWIASEALVSTPRVALANDSTRLACRSPSYKAVMKFRRSGAAPEPLWARMTAGRSIRCARCRHAIIGLIQSAPLCIIYNASGPPVQEAGPAYLAIAT